MVVYDKDRNMFNKKGEILTVVALVSFVVLSGLTLLSSALLNQNKNQTTTTQAQSCTWESCSSWRCPGPNCDKCGIGPYYWYASGCPALPSQTGCCTPCGDVAKIYQSGAPETKCISDTGYKAGNDGCYHPDASVTCGAPPTTNPTQATNPTVKPTTIVIPTLTFTPAPPPPLTCNNLSSCASNTTDCTQLTACNGLCASDRIRCNMPVPIFGGGSAQLPVCCKTIVNPPSPEPTVPTVSPPKAVSCPALISCGTGRTNCGVVNACDKNCSGTQVLCAAGNKYTPNCCDRVAEPTEVPPPSVSPSKPASCSPIKACGLGRTGCKVMPSCTSSCSGSQELCTVQKDGIFAPNCCDKIQEPTEAPQPTSPPAQNPPSLSCTGLPTCRNDAIDCTRAYICNAACSGTKQLCTTKEGNNSIPWCCGSPPQPQPTPELAQKKVKLTVEIKLVNCTSVYTLRKYTLQSPFMGPEVIIEKVYPTENKNVQSAYAEYSNSYIKKPVLGDLVQMDLYAGIVSVENANTFLMPADRKTFTYSTLKENDTIGFQINHVCSLPPEPKEVIPFNEISFSSNQVSLKSGEAIVFINQGEGDLAVSGSVPGRQTDKFSSGLMPKGATFVHQFTAPGSYLIYVENADKHATGATARINVN